MVQLSFVPELNISTINIKIAMKCAVDLHAPHFHFFPYTVISSVQMFPLSTIKNTTDGQPGILLHALQRAKPL